LFEPKDIVNALGHELIHSPEVLRAVKLAFARLTPEERELVVNKIKIGVPTTALMKRFGITSAHGCEEIYQRTLAILRIYIAYFAQTEDPELWRQLPSMARPYGQLLSRIFQGFDRNCLIAATDHTGGELDAQIECAAKAAESIKDDETRALVEAAVALYEHKRLGSTPPKRAATPARKPYRQRSN
jgi:hypothetical protein